MGRDASSRGRMKEPPVHDYRRKTGNHHQKIGRVERSDMQAKAIARRQELPVRNAVLVLISFAAFCSLLYIYLKHIVEEEEDA